MLDGDKRLRSVTVDRGEDLQPSKDGPNAILLTDVVRTSTEALFSADEGSVILSSVKSLGIHQVTKVFPASGGLKQIKVEILGDEINGTGRRHRTSDTVEATLSTEVGDDIGVSGDDGQRIRRGNKELSTKDHVAITITIGSGAERGNGTVDTNLIALPVKAHDGDKFFGVRKVGIGVASIEVILGIGVHTGALGLAKLVNEDGLGVGSVDAVHGIVNHTEIRAVKESLNRGKVEDALKESNMRLCRINNLDGYLRRAIIASDGGATDGGNVDSREVLADVVPLHSGSILVDLIGQLLRSRTAILAVVLDTKIFLRSTGIVRSGEDEGTEGLLPYRPTLTDNG
mmetsp:Transcript_24172/g.52352  ORF Transcript_24172/g.52352 Transcript_24172/m.52352 type:complete len:343 (-) Transcript_24172:1740-2768(-)